MYPSDQNALASLEIDHLPELGKLLDAEIGRPVVFGHPVHVVRSAGHSNTLLRLAIARPVDPEVRGHRRTVLEP